MLITIDSSDDMSFALAGFQPPESCDTVRIVAREVRRFTNCFLNSPMNCRVVVDSTTEPAVSYAGMFSGCRYLSQQPLVDTAKCINLAAFFRSCESIRFSTHWIKTHNVRDMRQMFLNCSNFSGNGVQGFDFSSLAGADAMRNFAYGTKFRTRFYDEVIGSLYSQMQAGTLPTPMSAVHFGAARYSPAVAAKRQALVDYGWELIDAGEETVPLSILEEQFSESVDSRLNNLPGDIDCSPVCTSYRGGIAITPRHTLHVKHYRPAVGQSIKLWNGEQATVQRVDAADWDVAIATLDRDCDVTPALVLPRDWLTLLPNAAGPPTSYPAGSAPGMLWFNRRNEIGVCDFSYASTTSPLCQAAVSADPRRAQHTLVISSGDSGSPVCFVYGNRLVAAWALQTSNGKGIWLAGVRDWADGVVARTGHTLTDIVP